MRKTPYSRDSVRSVPVLQLDGSIVDVADCRCAPDWCIMPLDYVCECPIDRHRIAWLQRHPLFDDAGRYTLDILQQSIADADAATACKLACTNSGYVVLED